MKTVLKNLSPITYPYFSLITPLLKAVFKP